MFGHIYLGSGDVPLYSPVFLGCQAFAVALGYLFVRHSRTDARRSCLSDCSAAAGSG